MTMLNEIIERLEQYWTTFYNAPVEMQVVGGALGLGTIYMVSGATGKLWKLLLPVRWVSAKILSTGSMLMYCSKNATKQKLEETPYFNTYTFNNFERTCDYYRKGDRVTLLSDEDLEKLHTIYCSFYFNESKKYHFLSKEMLVRDDNKKLNSINTTLKNPWPDKSLDGPNTKSDPVNKFQGINKKIEVGDVVNYDGGAYKVVNKETGFMNSKQLKLVYYYISPIGIYAPEKNRGQWVSNDDLGYPPEF